MKRAWRGDRIIAAGERSAGTDHGGRRSLSSRQYTGVAQFGDIGGASPRHLLIIRYRKGEGTIGGIRIFFWERRRSVRFSFGAGGTAFCMNVRWGLPCVHQREHAAVRRSMLKAPVFVSTGVWCESWVCCADLLSLPWRNGFLRSFLGREGILGAQGEWIVEAERAKHPLVHDLQQTVPLIQGTA